MISDHLSSSKTGHILKTQLLHNLQFEHWTHRLQPYLWIRDYLKEEWEQRIYLSGSSLVELTASYGFRKRTRSLVLELRFAAVNSNYSFSYEPWQLTSLSVTAYSFILLASIHPSTHQRILVMLEVKRKVHQETI